MRRRTLYCYISNCRYRFRRVGTPAEAEPLLVSPPTTCCSDSLECTRLYCCILLLLALFFASCGKKQLVLPPLKETFSKRDKNPFGSYVFYNQLKQLYYNNEINTEKQNFETVWQNISDTAAVYILISKNLFLSQAGQRSMLQYVNEGNSLFISSENIDGSLLDSLGCIEAPPLFVNGALSDIQTTSVKMDTAFFEDTSAYSYYYLPLSNHFKSYDTSITNVLGTNAAGKADFIEVFYGKGRFYLHCEPRALSNYFLLQKINYQYLQNIFQPGSTTPEHVYWDDYYNKKNYPDNSMGSKNAVDLLLQYPATAWAFWLALILLALYILFGGKRRQRIIEKILPNTNTTVAFTETVGRLYLQKKDNRNIAQKMITYFQEHIRKQYYLNTNQVNDDFITALSRKANVPKETTAALFQSIDMVHNLPEVSDRQLLLLNQQIEYFYKNKT